MEFIAVCWALFLGVWFIGAFRASPPTSNSGKRIAVRLGGLLLILLLFSLPIINRYFHVAVVVNVNPILGWASVALAAIGVGIAIWARIYLGRNWGGPQMIQQEHSLVTSGPYRYIRHPIYTGVLLALLGAVLVQGIVWIVVFFCFLYYFIRSARIEEERMTKLFPDSYPVYMSHTKIFLPFLY